MPWQQYLYSSTGAASLLFMLMMYYFRRQTRQTYFGPWILGWLVSAAAMGAMILLPQLTDRATLPHLEPLIHFASSIVISLMLLVGINRLAAARTQEWWFVLAGAAVVWAGIGFGTRVPYYLVSVSFQLAHVGLLVSGAVTLFGKRHRFSTVYTLLFWGIWSRVLIQAFLPFAWATDLKIVTQAADYSVLVMLGVGTMISFFQRLRADVITREAKYSTIFQNMSEGVIQLKVQYGKSGEAEDYIVEDMNPGFEQLSSTPRESALGRLVTRLWNLPEAPFLSLFPQIAEFGTRTQFETRFDFMDKDLSLSAFSPQRGRFVLVASDITQRRRDESELARYREHLEELVNERTEELSRANAALSEEISFRREAQESLNVANLRLNQSIYRLQEYSRRLELLNQMGEKLQSCRTSEETFGALKDSMEQIFAGSQGAISILGDEGLPEVSMSWGEGVAIPTGLTTPATREEISQIVERSSEFTSDEEKCLTVSELEVPLEAQGELFGRMWIQLSAQEDDQSDMGNGRHMVFAVAEQFSLSFANLKQRERLRIQSVRDPLTGLFNRRYMEESFARELARSQRTETPLGVILLDIDFFKKINDNYGHDIGDEVLRNLGSLLPQSIRTSDIACRYGGEEFLLLLPGANTEQTHRRASQICQNIKEQVLLVRDKGELRYSVSVGVAVVPIHGLNMESVIHAADKALYTSKKNGRDQITVAS